MKKIYSLDNYFDKKGTQWIFTGKKLKVYIPAIYENRNLLELGTKVTSLGIFQLRINDALIADMLLLNQLVMSPSNTERITEDGYQYVVLSFNKGDIFVNNTDLVKNGKLAYDVYMMFISGGKIPPFMSYDNVQALFDNDKKCCDISLNVNHSVFEMIYAHMYRDKADPFQFYRLTAMKKPPTVVSMMQISHGPTSNSSRMIGAYMNEGVVAALVNDPDKDSQSLIENIMRA